MIEALMAQLAECWPKLDVDRTLLTRALAARDIAPTDALALDVALVVALAGQDAGAVEILDRELLPDVRGALHRFGRDDDFVDEVLQRVRVKLLTTEGQEPAQIAEYRGRGPLAAWIQIIAIREALMMLRSARRDVQDDEILVRIAYSEPLLAHGRQRFKEQFATAFRRAMGELDQRDRTLLRLCFVEGAGTPELAKLYGVHRATAFRWMRDARERLLERTRDYFLASSGLSESEIDSVMRSLAESLSVSW